MNLVHGYEIKDPNETLKENIELRIKNQKLIEALTAVVNEGVQLKISTWKLIESAEEELI